jgi:AbrB family looped-hinge helix DNA binding protein
MLQMEAKLNANGRVVIPAALRKALDLRPGLSS